MQTRVVFFMIGKLMVIMGCGMALPLFTALYYQEKEAKVFLFCMLLTIFCGWIMQKMLRTDKKMKAKDGFAIVTYGWIVVSVFGMLPYLLSGAIPNVVDAFFETMSGFSTTGATILVDIESMGHGILMWRSMTQWLGGLGILVLFIALLSSVDSNGIQIFKAEMPGPMSEKIAPRITDTAKILWLIYLIFTGIATVSYWVLGMGLFDALCHGFTTLATGGFSTKNASLAYFNSPAIEWAATLFMFMSGINLALYYTVWKAKKKWQTFWSVKIVRIYFAVVFSVAALIAVQLIMVQDVAILEALRQSAFQVVAIITTTGYVTADFELWPSLSYCLMFGLFFLGACAGSTSGGMKLDRYIILFGQMINELKSFLHPRLVTSLKVDRKPIHGNIIANTAIFFFLFIVLVAVSTLLFACIGLTPADSFAVAVSALGNVGPSIGSYGPTETYASMPACGKLLMTALMLIGRLEIYTVLVTLLPFGKKGKVKSQRIDMK